MTYTTSMTEKNVSKPQITPHLLVGGETDLANDHQQFFHFKKHLLAVYCTQHLLRFAYRSPLNLTTTV